MSSNPPQNPSEPSDDPPSPEADPLWSLDEDFDSPAGIPTGTRLPTRRRKEVEDAPQAPATPEKTPAEANSPPARGIAAKPRIEKSIGVIRLDVSPSAGAPAPEKPDPPDAASPDDPIGQLSDWDIEESRTPSPASESTPEPEPATQPSPEPEPADEPAPPPETESTPAPGPAPHTVRKSLSPLEKGGVALLLILLLTVAVVGYRFSINRLPDSRSTSKADLPAKGTHLSVQSAETWWKPPSESDRVRRGTILIPGVTLVFGPSRGAVRLRFRNDAGETVGDLITRPAPSAGTMEISGTAGFEDLALHAQYRTDESKSWTLEALEAPSVDSPAKDFKLLFTTPVSATRKP